MKALQSLLDALIEILITLSLSIFSNGQPLGKKGPSHSFETDRSLELSIHVLVHPLNHLRDLDRLDILRLELVLVEQDQLKRNIFGHIADSEVDAHI